MIDLEVNNDIGEDKFKLTTLTKLTLFLPLLIGVYYLAQAAYYVEGPINKVEPLQLNSTCTYNQILKENGGTSTIGDWDIRLFPSIIFFPTIYIMSCLIIYLLTNAYQGLIAIKFRCIVLKRGSGGIVTISIFLIFLFFMQSLYNSGSYTKYPEKEIICNNERYIAYASPQLIDDESRAALNLTTMFAFLLYVISLTIDNYSKLSVTHLSPSIYVISRYMMRENKIENMLNIWTMVKGYMNMNSTKECLSDLTQIDDDVRRGLIFNYIVYDNHQKRLKDKVKLFWWSHVKNTHSIFDGVLAYKIDEDDTLSNKSAVLSEINESMDNNIEQKSVETLQNNNNSVLKS